MTKFEIEEKIVAMLKTVYDPEIPVDVYNLGLIYKIDVTDDFDITVDMTLTAPNCPAHRGSKVCHRQPCVRAGMGQGHDERGGEAGTGIPLRK